MLRELLYLASWKTAEQAFQSLPSFLILLASFLNQIQPIQQIVGVFKLVEFGLKRYVCTAAKTEEKNILMPLLVAKPKRPQPFQMHTEASS